MLSAEEATRDSNVEGSSGSAIDALHDNKAVSALQMCERA